MPEPISCCHLNAPLASWLAPPLQPSHWLSAAQRQCGGGGGGGGGGGRQAYQLSFIHRMASSSLNCLSNSYSWSASTDMLAALLLHAAGDETTLGRARGVRAGWTRLLPRGLSSRISISLSLSLLRARAPAPPCFFFLLHPAEREPTPSSSAVLDPRVLAPAVLLPSQQGFWKTLN